MKINKKLEDFQDDILDIPSKKSGTSVSVGETSFELSNNTLVIRRSNKHYKEKTLIDFEDIIYTRVRKNSNLLLLILSIAIAVLVGGATYPFYRLIGNYSFIIMGVGFLISAILLIIYFSIRNVKITIYLKNSKPIVRTGKNMKLFAQTNDFFDELFYLKHRK